MELWALWVIAAVGFAAGEVLTLGFFLAPFAGGALAAAAVDLAGAPAAASVAAFLGVSVLGLGLLRPVARRHLRTPPRLRTGTAALIGRTALVLQDVDEDHGSVKIDGEVWTARSYLPGEVLPAGAHVQVVEIQGATALVSE